MSLESVRRFLDEKAPDIRILEMDTSTATVAQAAAAHGVEPGRIAKTLSLRIGERAILVVARGDARLDNRKTKAVFGAKSKMLDAEAARIVAVSAGRRIVALDERGTSLTTRRFADKLVQWRDAGADVDFVIGSADGLARSVKSNADVVLALSALTLPHGLARVLLVEQLYRAHSLLTGHPYHRA